MQLIQYVIEIVCLAILKRNPKNHRTLRDEKRLVEMSEDIKARGVICPPIAYRDGDALVLVDGHLRTDAAAIAGLKEISVLVCNRQPSESELLLIQARTALHRQDLNPIDLCDLLSNIVAVTKCSINELARSISKDQSFVSKVLKLRNGSPELRELVRDAKIDVERAYMIVAAESDPAKQNALLNEAKSMSREQLRARLSHPKQNDVKTTSARFAMPGNVTVIVQGRELSLAGCIEVLIETIRQLKKGQRDAHDINTLTRVMRNQLKQQPKSALKQ